MKEDELVNPFSGILTEVDPRVVQRLSAGIQQIAHYLDQEEFESFLAYFTDDSVYKITTYSAELRKEISYLDLDFRGLEVLLNGIVDHVRFPNKLIRHICPPVIHKIESERIFSTTKVAIYHVDLKGVGGLYAIGNYQDISESRPNSELRVIQRNVMLETRSFPFGSHLPL